MFKLSRRTAVAAATCLLPCLALSAPQNSQAP